MTKIGKLATALLKGEELSSRQIRARFGIANPRAAVFKLRTVKGIPVYTNESKGRSPFKYRVGSYSRRVLAAGYRALARGVETSRPVGVVIS